MYEDGDYILAYDWDMSVCLYYVAGVDGNVLRCNKTCYRDGRLAPKIDETPYLINKRRVIKKIVGV